MSAAQRRALTDLLAESGGDEGALALRALRTAAEWCAAAAPPAALERALAEILDAEVRRAQPRSERVGAEPATARQQLDAAAPSNEELAERHEQLRRHLAADRAVARAFPSAARAQDLLAQAERLLETVDAALAAAIAQRAEQGQPRLQLGDVRR
jgi:hypothetical protein